MKALRYAVPPVALALAFELGGCGGSSNKPATAESATPTVACAPAWMQAIGKHILALPNAWHGGSSDTQGVTLNGAGGSVTISVESAPPTPNSTLGAVVNLCFINQVIISGANAKGTFYASFDESNINDNDADDNNAWQENAGEASCSDQHGVALSETNGTKSTGLSQSSITAATEVVHATTNAMNTAIALAQVGGVSQLLATTCANVG